MSLFPKKDVKKSIENAKEILSQYSNFVRMANSEYEPKLTSSFSLEMKSFSNVNSEPQLNYLADKSQANEMLMSISTALNNLGIEERKLITDKYMGNMKIDEDFILLRYNMTKTPYYNKLNDSLLQFAEAFKFENKNTLLVFKQNLTEEKTRNF